MTGTAPRRAFKRRRLLLVVQLDSPVKARYSEVSGRPKLAGLFLVHVVLDTNVTKVKISPACSPNRLNKKKWRYCAALLITIP